MPRFHINISCFVFSFLRVEAISKSKVVIVVNVALAISPFWLLTRT